MGREKMLGKNGKRETARLIGNIIGIAMIAVLLPILLINLTLIVKSYVRPDRVPTVFGVAPLFVESGSMDPAIKVDDLIFTRKVDTAALKPGDVIAFQSAGAATVVTHRITEVFEENGARMFRTKGDWNNIEDPVLVHQDQVVGLYFRRAAGAGRLAQVLRQPAGMLVIVSMLGLLYLYDVLRRYLYNRKQKQLEAQPATLQMNS